MPWRCIACDMMFEEPAAFLFTPRCPYCSSTAFIDVSMEEFEEWNEIEEWNERIDDEEENLNTRGGII